MRRRSGKQTKGSDKHCHHDGAKAENGSFDCGFFDRVTADAHLVDVFQHNDTGLYGDTEECEEAYTGRDAKVSVREQKSEETTKGRHRNVDENEASPLTGVEHGVKDDED